MQQINVNELKPHPRNNEFFDDICGEKWDEFLQSVKSRGIIEPIVITHDKVIVSGHQRVRACKELDIGTIVCDVHTYDNEDQILQDLLETNIRQRGDVGGSAKKVGLRIKELERLYGIAHGGDRKSESSTNNSVLITQNDIATQMSMSVDTLQNFKILADMIPELSTLVDTGTVTKTTALSLMKQLSPQEQEELVSSMDTTKKLTQKEVQKYVDEINELKSNPPLPTDYNSTKKELKDYKTDYQNLQEQFQSKVTELQESRKQIDAMKQTSPTETYNQKLKDSTIFFCSKVADFIEKVGGYAWLTDHINELPEYEKKSFISAINAVNAWSNTILNNINN